VVLYPLWLGDMPALLKAFLEQTLRPGFLRASGKLDMFGKGTLTGKSARIIVTMGMPALVYYWYFGAHSLKSLERNILRFAGMKPVRSTVLGGVGNVGARRLDRLRAMMRKLGHACS
jgi:putative NADPH-quinone reductase